VTATETSPAPVVSVTRGQPTAAELAAVVAVLLAAAAARPATAPPGPRRSVWAGSARTRGALPPPGLRSWRTSALPS
jgi:Acyl-CoA carboxylase epsilon subunit